MIGTLDRNIARSDLADVAAALRGALTRLNRRLRAEEVPHGVGATGLSILGRLYRSGPAGPTALASSERVALQSLTRVLRALEAQGLVTRTVDAADRRRSTVAIAPPGIAALRASARSREAWLARALETALTPTERDLLDLITPLLERLADADA